MENPREWTTNINSVYDIPDRLVVNKLVTQQFNVIPSGMIIMWHGSLASVPQGWAACDGTNGTPNLTNRFIVGGNTVGTGNSSINISGSASSAGNHTHSVTANKRTFTKDVTGCFDDKTNGITSFSMGSTGNHTHTVTINNVVDDTLFPKSASLIFIMKI
jgi:hypothetical protein